MHVSRILLAMSNDLHRRVFVFLLILAFAASDNEMASMETTTPSAEKPEPSAGAQLPGQTYEFKLRIDAGKEDCFYQMVEPLANLFVAFQVIRGGDGKAGLAVRHPNGVHVHPYQWLSETEYEEVSREGGIYEICVDNQFSRFSGKLINLYISSFRYDEWESYTAEVEKLDISVTQFTDSLKLVDGRISEMLRYQQFARRHEARDHQLLIANNAYVQYWSLVQCAVILVTSSLQVYFVRKLFLVKNTTGTLKPRA